MLVQYAILSHYIEGFSINIWTIVEWLFTIELENKITLFIVTLWIINLFLLPTKTGCANLVQAANPTLECQSEELRSNYIGWYSKEKYHEIVWHYQNTYIVFVRYKQSDSNWLAGPTTQQYIIRLFSWWQYNPDIYLQSPANKMQ